MTWIGGRREGWVPRKSVLHRTPSHPVPAEAVPLPIAIPPFPSFSPASIAQLLGVYRSTVQYWITAGKLECYRDNIGEAYVLRAELIRFIREYLQRPMTNVKGP
jgi:excisionase family DNA binding protein